MCVVMEEQYINGLLAAALLSLLILGVPLRSYIPATTAVPSACVCVCACLLAARARI